jgi:hypothetical protein
VFIVTYVRFKIDVTSDENITKLQAVGKEIRESYELGYHAAVTGKTTHKETIEGDMVYSILIIKNINLICH